MRVAPGLHVEWVDDEAVILHPETKELHHLNGPAALAFALMSEHGVTRGLEELRSSHGHAASFEDDVAQLLEELTAKGLLLE